MEYLNIELPLPNSKLSSNHKDGQHWSEFHRAKKSDKEIGYYLAYEALKKNKVTFTKNDNLECMLHFYLGSNKKRDWDNLVASFKNMQDGICNALRIDDDQITEVSIKKIPDASVPAHVFFVLQQIK